MHQEKKSFSAQHKIGYLVLQMSHNGILHWHCLLTCIAKALGNADIFF